MWFFKYLFNLPICNGWNLSSESSFSSYAGNSVFYSGRQTLAVFLQPAFSPLCPLVVTVPFVLLHFMSILWLFPNITIKIQFAVRNAMNVKHKNYIFIKMIELRMKRSILMIALQTETCTVTCIACSLVSRNSKFY